MKSGDLHKLTEDELQQITGGWHPFPRGIFGRDGKPAIGRDVFRAGIPIVVRAGVSVIPGGAGWAEAAGAAAGVIVRKNT